jgi:ribonucleotide reductase alpha subunit
MLEFTRVLSNADTDPYDDFDWVFEDITIKDEKERVIFSCARAEFPAGWSDLAKKIVASKYFRADRKGDGEETSVRQMVERVVSFITNEGLKQKYFEGENAKIFHDELVHLILRQMGTFNSPVWFNAGVPGVTKPQNSACFINQVDDSMESILDLAKTEGLIFKEGSGSGVNLSALRGSNEKVKGGGTASGPVSFMSGYDAFANVILSGGRTRRAARMAILDIDHPDIRKFINCKSEQEDIVKLLVLGGMSPVFTAENNAYDIVKHQSGNNSVMLTDKFMERVRDILHGYKPDHQWDLINRVGGEIAETLSVKDLFFDIVKAAHKCGDPGLQFSDTINAGNTCKADGKIVGSNPCLCGSMTLATPKGNRKIKTLAKEGTAKIINSKGNTVDSNIWSSGIRPVVKICFSHRTRIPPLRCTPDHVWKLNDGTTEEAQNLLRHTRLMPYIVMKENYDKDAFLAGFIQGDGSPQRLKSKPHKGLEIHLASKDTEIALMYDQIPGPRKWYSRYGAS